MSVDYFIACLGCREFTSLHARQINPKAANALLMAHGLRHGPCGGYAHRVNESISSQPIVELESGDLLDVLGHDNANGHIDELIPTVGQFADAHRDHQLFITCDIGDLPWDIGEPEWATWKEIGRPEHHYGKFLPRNLIDDFAFASWNDVMTYYEAHELWFLHEQLSRDLASLKAAFERLSAENKC